MKTLTYIGILIIAMITLSCEDIQQKLTEEKEVPAAPVQENKVDYAGQVAVGIQRLNASTDDKQIQRFAQKLAFLYRKWGYYLWRMSDLGSKDAITNKADYDLTLEIIEKYTLAFSTAKKYKQEKTLAVFNQPKDIGVRLALLQSRVNALYAHVRTGTRPETIDAGFWDYLIEAVKSGALVLESLAKDAGVALGVIDDSDLPGGTGRTQKEYEIVPVEADPIAATKLVAAQKTDAAKIKDYAQQIEEAYAKIEANNNVPYYAEKLSRVYGLWGNALYRMSGIHSKSAIADDEQYNELIEIADKYQKVLDAIEKYESVMLNGSYYREQFNLHNKKKFKKVNALLEAYEKANYDDSASRVGDSSAPADTGSTRLVSRVIFTPDFKTAEDISSKEQLWSLFQAHIENGVYSVAKADGKITALESTVDANTPQKDKDEVAYIRAQFDALYGEALQRSADDAADTAILTEAQDAAVTVSNGRAWYTLHRTFEDKAYEVSQMFKKARSVPKAKAVFIYYDKALTALDNAIAFRRTETDVETARPEEVKAFNDRIVFLNDEKGDIYDKIGRFLRGNVYNAYKAKALTEDDYMGAQRALKMFLKAYEHFDRDGGLFSHNVNQIRIRVKLLRDVLVNSGSIYNDSDLIAQVDQMVAEIKKVN